jgi:hypothetical protein
MRKIALWVILVAASAKGQTIQHLLLPEARRIVGVVVDLEGQPVAEAHIDHSNDRLQAHQTDSSGKFTLDTRAPILVVRKPGFRSELVRTQGSTEVRVVLQKLTGSGAFPICSKSGKHEGIEGWGAWFQFPKIPGIKASRQGADIDYGARSYSIATKHGRKWISHGSGPFWGLGTPTDLDVWRSVSYDEAVFDVGGQTISDARGQLPNGNRWRTLGKFGESASYTDIDQATAKVLDRFLDGACLKSTPPL